VAVEQKRRVRKVIPDLAADNTVHPDSHFQVSNTVEK
jgi:hypothetical protein